jgi:hypothetical protein
MDPVNVLHPLFGLFRVQQPPDLHRDAQTQSDWDDDDEPTKPSLLPPTRLPLGRRVAAAGAEAGRGYENPGGRGTLLGRLA